jgi:HAMP domain-containing protein
VCRDTQISLAKLAAEEQQQIVQGIRQVLIALSELPAIKAKDSTACNASLAGIKSRFPAFLTFIVTDQNGQPFCDTSSEHKPINVSARAYFADALKTRAFTVGEFSIGLSVHRKVIQFALPFYGDDGQIGGVIIAPLGLDWLADYIARMGIPTGDALAITDRNGTYLARFPNNSQFVGKKLLPAGKETQLGHELTADLVDVDGVERIVGVSALGPDSGGLRVSFGLDKIGAFAEIQRRTRHDILLITLSALIVLVLTLLGARQFIHRPLGLLVAAANQWRLGDYAPRVNIRDRSEIARVADAFNTMADALERRERELSDAKERAEDAAARLTMVFESTDDSVVTVGRDWCISFCNQRARTQIAEGQELIGTNLQDAVLVAPDTEILSQLREAMSDRHPVSFEVHCPRRGVWYAVNAFPSGEGLAIFFRDVTEHKHAVKARPAY